MTITTTAWHSAGLAVTLLVAAGLSGCGGGDTQAACTRVQAEIANITSQGMVNVSDPKSLKKVYDDGAVQLREMAKGTDIADETENVAVAMERIGQQVADFAANPGTTMPQLDSAGLTSAGVALKNACS